MALQVPEEELLRRALVRDRHLFGTAVDTEHRYRTRYLPAQRLYEMEVGPAERADIVLDNSDPASPIVMRWA